MQYNPLFPFLSPMAQRIDGREVPLHVKADICDYVAEGATEEERSERRAEMADRYKKTISRESISAMTAHTKFRLRDAKHAIGAHLRDKEAQFDAAEEGAAFAEGEGVEGKTFGGAFSRAHQKVRRSAQAYELLRDGSLSEAIAEFGKANDVEALRHIADVYERERPDIAAQALLAANDIVGVLAIVGRLVHGNRESARRILAMIETKPS